MTEAPLIGFFQAGIVVMTPGARALGLDLKPYLRRHLWADWGDVSDATRARNDQAVAQGDEDEDSIESVYTTPAGILCIKTEWDRSATTIYLPEED